MRVDVVGRMISSRVGRQRRQRQARLGRQGICARRGSAFYSSLKIFICAKCHYGETIDDVLFSQRLPRLLPPGRRTRRLLSRGRLVLAAVSILNFALSLCLHALCPLPSPISLIALLHFVFHRSHIIRNTRPPCFTTLKSALHFYHTWLSVVSTPRYSTKYKSCTQKKTLAVSNGGSYTVAALQVKWPRSTPRAAFFHIHVNGGIIPLKLKHTTIYFNKNYDNNTIN